jgi:hypothetical protein
MATGLLQRQHHFSKLSGGYPLPEPFVADIEILTEITHQIAMGKKNGARPTAAHKRRLFSEMRTVAGDPRVRAGVADPCLTGTAVDAALSRAQPAGLQALSSRLYPFRKYAPLNQIYI